MTSDAESMSEHHDLVGEEGEWRKRQFGNYDLIRRIDRGGAGEVYLAHQRSAFQREVAIKVVRENLASDPVARARFFREIEVSSHLKREHVLPLFDFGEVEGGFFLVTPYISGGSLAERLQASPLALAEVQQVFSALVRAVAYIHRRGIVHGDLKPGTILLDHEEVTGRLYVRLINFGSAAKQDEETSPRLEAVDGEDVAPASPVSERPGGGAMASDDIYALGVILSQMLSACRSVEEAGASNSLLSPLEEVARRCAAENPEDRYASAADVLRAFERASQPPPAPLILPAIYQELSVIAVAGGRRSARGGRGRPKRLGVIASLSFVAALAAVVGLLFSQSPLAFSATITLRTQERVLQRVYTITAIPSQSGIDVATLSIPAYSQTESQTGSQTAQILARQCRQPFFVRCRQMVTLLDVENVSSQLQQSLAAQLSAEIDNQLQAKQAIEVGSKQFTDLSQESNPAVGAVSQVVTVTLTEQGRAQYISNADVLHLVRLLLAQKLGSYTTLLDSTVQIGQPVVEGMSNLNVVTMRVAAAGIEEYQYPPARLQTIANHLTGMTPASARAYLQRLPGVDANSVSLSLYALFGGTNTLPSNTSQIKIILLTPTSPSISLPTVTT